MRLLHSLPLALACALACLLGGAADPTVDERLAQLRNADAKTRRLAADSLGRAKLESAIPPLIAALSDVDAGVRASAAKALRRIGPKTFAPQVAAVAKLSTDDKRSILESLIELAPRAIESSFAADTVAIAKLLADRDTEVRIHATVLLGAIGAPAKRLLPTLLDQVVDPARTPYIRPGNIPGNLSEATVQAILRIDPQSQESIAKAAMPALLKLLESGDRSKADSAARVIEKLGPHGRAAEPALLAALDRAERFEGYAIRSALLKVGDRYARQLERTVRDPEAPAQSRAEALRALNGAPPSADATFATLLALTLADEEPVLRAAAVDLCWMSESRAKPVIKDLVRLLGDRALDAARDPTRIGVEDTLVRAIRQAGPEAIPLLVEVVANRRISPFKRIQAAQALVLFGRTARPALNALESAMTSDNAALEAHAATAFLAAGGDLAKARLAFERALKARTESIQADVLHKMSEVGDRLEPLAPVILPFLDSDEREVRIAAARTLSKFSAAAKIPAKAIAARMVAGDSRERYQLAQSLSAMGPLAVDAMPELIASLDDLGNGSPNPALTCLANIGLEAKAAVPKLVGILEGGKKLQFHSSQTIEVLAAIGPGAKEATAALAARLKDPKDYQRSKVLKALGCIGPDAKVALPAIEKLVDDQDLIVSAWARFATVRIAGTKEPHLTVLRQMWEDQRELRLPNGGFRFGTDFPDLCVQLGPDAAPFRDLLLADFLDPKVGVGTQATIAKSLGKMASDADVIVPKLVAAIDRYPQDVFGKDRLTNTVSTLANLGLAAKEAIPRLRRLAEESEYDSIATAAEKAVQRIEGRAN